MDKILKYGIIGLGERGKCLLRDVLIPMSRDEHLIELAAVCDEYEDRTLYAADLIEAECKNRPFITQDYRDILAIDAIDAVVIASAWESHVDVAVAAMRAGKYTGMEVGGAYAIEDCWKLVETHEETGTHCMFLENCCYGKRELMILNMYRQGLLGTVVHCEGGYHHDLRQEIAFGQENRHYRLRNYLNRNCENYPTHEIGPIAKLLDINNGNRFVSLTSTASGAWGLHEYITRQKEPQDPLANAVFAQGDVVTTVLKTAHGQTVTITLDTTLPRAYSRGFTIRGTKGAYFEDMDMIFLDGEHNSFDFKPEGIWGNAGQYEEQYLHPLWKDHVPLGGHGGMDGLVLYSFYEAVKANVRPAIDVYDAAAYMSITALSEQSIRCGSMPVAVPDFTKGRFCRRNDIVDGSYNLDRVDQREA